MDPPTLVIALSASTATIGDLSPAAYPILHTLITSSLGHPHAPPTFTSILSQLEKAPFHAHPHMANQYGITFHSSLPTNLSQTLQHILQVALQSPHHLSRAQELIDAQSDADMLGSFEPDGVISCFLRRVNVAFALLTFESLARLLQQVTEYVSGNLEQRTPGVADAQQVVRQLEDGVALESSQQVQAWTNVYRESRQPTAATNAAIQSIHGQTERRNDVVLLTAEYAAHTEARRRRDFSTSVDALHRYFDLSLAELGRRSAELHTNVQEERESASATPNELQGHQYAALSLGILHASFGNARSAEVALDDTIRAAQQCGDQACQASALSWIARTCESVMRRHQLLGHSGEQLAMAREEISTVFTPGGDEIGSTGERKNRASERLASIRKRLRYDKPEQRVEALLMSAAAWESHAALPTALSVAESAWRIVKTKRLREDKARAAVAVASLCARQGEFERAVQLLRENGARDGVVGSECNIDDATDAPEVEIMSRCLAWLQFEHCVTKGDVLQAERLLEVIKGFEVCARYTAIPLVAEDIVLDTIEAKCKFQLLSGSCQEAAREADLLCRRAARFAKPGRVVEGMRLRAEAHLQNELYSSALPAALAAVSLSDGLGLEAAKVKSVLTLTETILHMEEQEVVSGARALKALLPVLPLALNGMGISERARAYRLQAECLLATASDAGDTPGRHVVELIEQACEAYKLCGDAIGIRDALYLLARVYHWRGEHGARNAAACKFNEQVQLMSRQRLCTT